MGNMLQREMQLLMSNYIGKYTTNAFLLFIHLTTFSVSFASQDSNIAFEMQNSDGGGDSDSDSDSDGDGDGDGDGDAGPIGDPADRRESGGNSKPKDTYTFDVDFISMSDNYDTGESLLEYDYAIRSSTGVNINLDESGGFSLEISGSFSKLPNSFSDIKYGTGLSFTAGLDGSLSVGMGAGVPLIAGISSEVVISPVNKRGNIKTTLRLIGVSGSMELNTTEVINNIDSNIDDSAHEIKTYLEYGIKNNLSPLSY